mgnify:FL=1
MVRLSKFDKKDIEFFYYEVFSDYNDVALWSNPVTINTIEECDRYLTYNFNNTYADFFMIRDEEGNTLGFVYSYNYVSFNGNLSIATYISKKYRNCGAGAKATILFVDFLFKKYPLIKVYSPVFSYNLNSIFNHEKSGFVKEAVLKNANTLMENTMI